MWTNDETVAAGQSMDPARWRGAFEVLMGRIAGRFARVEPPRMCEGRSVRRSSHHDAFFPTQ
ncbi:hypothetical protein CEB94_38895 [Streptomyces hawaiiensis]|uniref:Uncharacterized protein n=1 Tax=Streptomyces hawaiiensis TaxID=67305 RepID=A0A6G5RQM9_9ACTN|nr:hypothetical protein CEB94_38895 [Streptomyces hawaiiensis]